MRVAPTTRTSRKGRGAQVKKLGVGITALVTLLAAVFVGLLAFGKLSVGNGNGNGSSGSPTLAKPDVPPLEFAYLDSARVSEYLGQAENGLIRSETRATQIKKSLNAALSAGGNATLGADQQDEESSSATVEPDGADRFYTFVRLLHAETPANARPAASGKSCASATHRKGWLSDVDFGEKAKNVVREFGCIGVGNFVRIDDVELFVPPFAQALPRLRSANTFYGSLPAPKARFTSPTQSVALRHALTDYVARLGTTARVPFVGAPYGEGSKLGTRIPVFMPTEYRDITQEPSLLAGPVTVVGKLVYVELTSPPVKHVRGRRPKPAPPAYIDYATVDKFGQALLRSRPIFRADLGVCSKAPTLQTRAQAPLGTTLPLAGGNASSRAAQRQAAQSGSKRRASARNAKRQCTSSQAMINEVKKDVSFRPPFVIVRPLAIYD
jgi:hypothetical protein